MFWVSQAFLPIKHLGYLQTLTENLMQFYLLKYAIKCKNSQIWKIKFLLIELNSIEKILSQSLKNAEKPNIPDISMNILLLIFFAEH